MTAESLKPFLNLPNGTANELKAKCAQKSTAKCALAILGYTLVAAFCCTVIGVEVWHLSVTDALQREVDDLKLQLKELSMPRAGDFNDYEFDNELFDHGDEYSTAYESEDFDSQPSEDGSDDDGGDDGDTEDDGDDEDSSLVGTGALRSEYGELDEENDELLQAWRKPLATVGDNGGADKPTGKDALTLLDESIDEDISVSVLEGDSNGNGARRARSISGVTHQGVPIVDEPYVPRRNRSRPRPHRIYEQLRQRPEELVTPPSTSDMFRWDVESSSSSRQSSVSHHASHPTQQYGSISIRPFHQEAHGRREGHHHQGTTPMPVSSYESSARHSYARNQLNAAPTTSAPAAILNRHSRVQATSDQGSGGQRAALLQQTRFPKVVGNPGTQKEIVMTPESRVRMRTRKAGTVQNGGEPVAKGVHLVKQFVHGVRHRNTRHTHWQATGESNKHSVLSRIFTFDGEQLTVNEPGLYYVYAQITYDNQHDVNGFKVLIGGQKHLSCTVHARGENTNTCFTAGLAEITTAGTHIAIEDVDHGRQHVMYPEKTFFGAFKVGRLPPVSQVAKRNV